MTPPPKEESGFNAIEAFQDLLSLIPFYKPATSRHLSKTPSQRQAASTATDSLENDSSLPTKVLDHPPTATDDIKSPDPDETVLYLAYGSNLFSKTFLGRRGIRPLSQVNVLVPELRLTFDMPGLPYVEPCFAATRFRSEVEELYGEEVEDDNEGESMSEKIPLMLNNDYHKDRWRKPLIGVVYEVTLADYARIIATEGGGRGYRDIIVDCYPFPESYSPTDPVPDIPETKPFKAHSLLSPAVGGGECKRGKGPGVRPNPCHAQPSARYLKLINSGAAEHDLPLSYREYLGQIRSFRITTTRQKVGKALFMILWGPTFMILLAASQFFAGPDGRSPPWLIAIMDLIYGAMWSSYDTVFVKIFGEGERTIGDT